MDENFLRVLFPVRCRVLGRWLPPLSYWHLAGLAALDSPLLHASREARLADLQLAVKVAHSRWPHPADLRPTLRDFWQRQRRDRDQAFLERETAAFLVWKSTHELSPEFWQNEDECPRLLTAPAILARVAQLERLTKFTHAQAWNDVTPGYASWLVATINEQNGAELRFLQEGDDDDSNEPPDLTQMSEDELCAYLAADIGAEEANAFMARRSALRSLNPQPSTLN